MMLALVAALTLLPLGASADTPVRTGTTEVVPHPDQGKLEAPVEPSHLPPGDAPIVSGDAPKLPPLPQGFNTHEGGWIKISYFASLRERVQPLITQADDARAELTSRLGYPVLDNVTVYIARTPGEMATLAPEGAPFPKYAAGVAYPQLGLVLLTIQSLHPNSRHDLVEIFRHELAHLSLYRAVRGRSVPRWFNEDGALAWGDLLARPQTLRTATLDELMPPRRWSAPSRRRRRCMVAYAQAADVALPRATQDQHRFRAMIERIRGGQISSVRRLRRRSGHARVRMARRRRPPLHVLAGFLQRQLGPIGTGLFAWGCRRRAARNARALGQRGRSRDKAPRDGLAPPCVHIVFARGTQRLPDSAAPPMDAEVPAGTTAAGTH
jgi:hypothetical protein